MKVGPRPRVRRARRAALIRDLLGSGRRADDGREPGLGRRRSDRCDGASSREFDPWWIEEPTSPDDVLGHARIRREIAPIRVATGEHVQNRVIFKQLFQAAAIDVCQIDACRVAGVNEVAGDSCCWPRSSASPCARTHGGVGLCEYVQHLAVFDFVSVSGSLENRVVEWVDHLHEHFRDPAVVEGGRYRVPRAPGYSIEIFPRRLKHMRLPGGPAWSHAEDARTVRDDRGRRAPSNSASLAPRPRGFALPRPAGGAVRGCVPDLP